MKDKKNIKKYIKWIIIATVFIVLYIVLALFINNQNDRKSNNYLLIGNKLIWNEIDGKFYQLTDVSDNLLKNKFTVDNGNKYQADNLQFTDRKWYFFDKDYNEIIYDDSSIAYSGDLDVSTISYDILNYSLSLTYIFSDTGIWNRDVEDYMDHTAIASFRYKYSENIDGWMSLGMTTETPFLAVGMRLTF